MLLQTLAIISQHRSISSFLIPLLFCSYILVKPFILLLSEVTKIFWKVVLMASKVMEFAAHDAAKIFEAA